jgi:hypothetical protein
MNISAGACVQKSSGAGRKRPAEAGRRNSMQRSKVIALALVAGLTLVAGTAGVLAQGKAARSATEEKWLHVSVVSHDDKGETVRVNVPLSLAEKVLAAIHKDKLQGGRIRVREFEVHGIDVRAIFEAVKDARDGEFVTVQSKHDNVRVAKEKGYLLVKVEETRRIEVKSEKQGEQPAIRESRDKVDVKVPMSVVEALLSAGKDEIDLVAAIRALAAHGDSILVSVEDNRNTVRVWVDSKNVSAI